MIPLAIIAAAMQVVIANPPTAVNEQDETFDGAAWQIIGDGAEFADPGETLRRGAVIARQRLVPKKLARVLSDVERIDGGDRWAEEGDQLFGATVGDLEAFCVMDTKLNVTVGMLFVPNRTRLIKIDCFVDSDDDGRLDQRFEADPGIGVLPNVARSEPRAFYDLEPVEFSLLDPREFEDESWVQIEFRGGARRDDDPPRFRVRYRYGGSTRRLDGESRPAIANYPAELRILGSQIQLDRRDDGKLTAQVIGPMKGSFGVITTLEYR